MHKTAIYLWSFLIAAVIFIAATIFIFFLLRARLSNANLETFKKYLGNNFQYRRQNNGWIKYKWVIGPMMFKASFDENGNLEKAP